MVVLHYKRTDNNTFLYETYADIPVAELLQKLVELNNMRLHVDAAAVAIEELASKGPMKPEQLRGLGDLDEYVKHEDLTVIEGLKLMPPQTGVRQVEDETNYRTGWVVAEQMTDQILKEVMVAKQLVHKTQVDRKVCLTMEMLQAQMDVFRGLMMMAYPGYHGLGDWEPIWLLLENKDNWHNNTDMSDFLDPKKCSLWAVNKEMNINKKFSDLFGKNEKTKLVCKIQSTGSGAPVREPTIDPETHKKMLSYYHKKQEEQKHLAEDNEDNFLNQGWADNTAMKQQMHGMGKINFR